MNPSFASVVCFFVLIDGQIQTQATFLTDRQTSTFNIFDGSLKGEDFITPGALTPPLSFP